MNYELAVDSYFDSLYNLQPLLKMDLDRS